MSDVCENNDDTVEVTICIDKDLFTRIVNHVEWLNDLGDVAYMHVDEYLRELVEIGAEREVGDV